MLGIYPVANVKFSNTGFDRSTLFQGREGSCAFFRATKIRLPLLPLPPSVTRAEARQRPRFNRATTRVSIQFRPTVHHRPTVSLVFLAALRRRNFFEGFTAVLPRDPTVDLTALLFPAVSIYPATLPLFLFLFSFFLARDRREREREDRVPVSHPRRFALPPLPPSIPAYSSFFRSSSPWATWSRSSRYGNRAESRWELTPSLFSPFLLRRCSSRCLSSSRIRLVFFLPFSLSFRSAIALPSFFNPTGMPARAVLLLVSLLTLLASSRPVSLV